MFAFFKSGFHKSLPVVDPSVVVHYHGWAAADSGLRTRKHFEPTCDRPAKYVERKASPECNVNFSERLTAAIDPAVRLSKSVGWGRKD